MESLNFKAIFEAVPNAYLILDPNLTIVGVSDSYLSATMTKRNEILNRHLFDVFPDNPDDPEASGTSLLRKSLEEVLHKKQPHTMAIQKYDIRRPGGDWEVRYWSPRNLPVLVDGMVKFIIHSVEDVTESVRLKDERTQEFQRAEKLQVQIQDAEKVRQAQKMEVMGRLAGGVAHDFNNILGVVLLSCDNALEHAADIDSVKSALNTIKDNCLRASSLTRQLLAFSRKQVLQPVPLNLNPVVVDMEKMLKRLLTENIEIRLNLDENLKNTLIDKGQVEQILMNLVLNARDSISRQGSITIQTLNCELDSLLAKATPPVPSGKYVMLSVTDTGSGMDAHTKARIFEPFFTTKPVGKGTGLGLFTVYGIVSQNKGTLWVYSEPGKGSTFKIYFPVLDAEVPEASAPLIKASAGNETILVVEDEFELRNMICDVLGSHGYSIHRASNGQEALDVIRSLGDSLKLIVTDVVMPELGGPEMIKRLSLNNFKVRVLYMSGYTDGTLSNYGLNQYPEFIEKPFTRQDLLSKVRSVLDKKI